MIVLILAIGLINIANNRFFGEIPDSLGSLRQIREFHFANNKFAGEIPSTLKNCTLLKTFDVAENNFSGLFPSWIGDALRLLRVVILRSNMFAGSLPFNFFHLSEVQILDLSMNNISGSVPKCLNNLSALANKTNYDGNISCSVLDNELRGLKGVVVVFGILVNDLFEDSLSLVWKGKEAKYQTILGLVKSIDLSNNTLTGEAPSEMMDLVGLVSSNLSRNKTNGEIPPSIGQLEPVDSLDLSRNHLFGRIPSEFAHIDRLSVMDSPFSKLSGEIPHGTQLQSFDAPAYVGNLDLCGAPLLSCPTKQARDDHENEGRDLEDDDQFFSQLVVYISFAMGFISGFWAVCCSLVLKKSWRHAYFKFWSEAYEKLYVIAVINTAKLADGLIFNSNHSLIHKPYQAIINYSLASLYI
ncbi:receptor-like protein EIX2 [Neltuma alba]|uniref:receptor-like protein EIX2 n=1 Tax=Neltuma alba TaxID=207710 RepID=UPI0010A5315D|nr:receptor-like protein EIX2 [Prosopis alba]